MTKRSLFVYLLLLATTIPDSRAAGPIVRWLNDSTVITSDGVALYTKKAGKGTPCIFVHGGPGAWSGSFQFMGGSILEKSLTMYYYDQRGSGRSASAPDKDYSLERMVEDIENIRSLTGAEQVYVLSHSFGGVLACAYAKKYPSHVKGLILLNSTLSINNSLLNQIAFVNKTLNAHFTAPNPDSVLPAFLAARQLLREKGLEYKMLSDNKATVDRLDSIDNSISRNTDFASQALGMPEYFTDFTKGTPDINVPVLVITGTADHNIGPDHYKLFRFPRSTVKVIDGGHILYCEKNKEFAAAVDAFVR